MEPTNSYEDEKRAAAYAALEFAGTYYLAYRDLPAILKEHASGHRAIDFGCGTGRSTRFLKRLGFEVIGLDISPEMLKIARASDPDGDYRLVRNGALAELELGEVDLILAAFTFDNVPELEAKAVILCELARLLGERGVLIVLVSSPEIYVNEWCSFSTKDFPENRLAKSGDTVRIVITDIDDDRPVVDTVCSDEDYRELFRRAGLCPSEVYRPLGRPEDPGEWKSEATIAPWVIYAAIPSPARIRH